VGADEQLRVTRVGDGGKWAQKEDGMAIAVAQMTKEEFREMIER
jgi:hypothetical protein